MKIYVILGIFSILFFYTTPLHATMTGGDFELFADTFSSTGGSVSSTGDDFGLYDTGGEFFATTTSGGTYELRGGFQALEKGVLSISLAKNTLSFGTLSTDSVSSDSLVATISSDSSSGYSLVVSEDGDLRRSDGTAIDDVSDGEVTAGTEEYGVRASGTDSALTAGMDYAIPVAGLTLASSSGTVTSNDLTATFRVAVGSNSLAGSYSQTLTFTVTANP